MCFGQGIVEEVPKVKSSQRDVGEVMKPVKYGSVGEVLGSENSWANKPLSLSASWMLKITELKICPEDALEYELWHTTDLDSWMSA